MLYGVGIGDSYEGPQIGAVEFKIHGGDTQKNRVILDSLSGRFGSVSAHLPSYMTASSVMDEISFDLDHKVDYFVAHITKHTPYESWREISQCGRKVVFENHNQDWHPTDAGWCRAEEFKPVVDAGHEICLDTGHILYSCMERGNLDEAEEVFEKFLELPIAACHLHTLGRDPNGLMVDHMLDGYDIGPWVRRIEEKFPNVIFLVETGHPQFSVADKLNALAKWREKPITL